MKQEGGFELERKLDAMLNYFVEINDVDHPVEMPDFSDKIALIRVLMHRKFIKREPSPANAFFATPRYNPPTITDSGIHFHLTTSFVSEAKRIQLEDKRWKLEFRKITSDNIMSILAILTSIAALAVAIFKD